MPDITRWACIRPNSARDRIRWRRHQPAKRSRRSSRCFRSLPRKAERTAPVTSGLEASQRAGPELESDDIRSLCTPSAVREDHVSQDSHCQPRRNRGPDHSHGARNGHRDGCRILRTGPQRAAREMADEAYFARARAPSQSYLNGDKLIDIAQRSGAQRQCIPDTDFLLRTLRSRGRSSPPDLTWVGPHADAIDAMGDKLRARQAMQKAEVPVVPGGTEAIADIAAARAAAERYGLAARPQGLRRRRRQGTEGRANAR